MKTHLTICLVLFIEHSEKLNSKSQNIEIKVCISHKENAILPFCSVVTALVFGICRGLIGRLIYLARSWIWMAEQILQCQYSSIHFYTFSVCFFVLYLFITQLLSFAIVVFQGHYWGLATCHHNEKCTF